MSRPSSFWVAVVGGGTWVLAQLIRIIVALSPPSVTDIQQLLGYVRIAAILDFIAWAGLIVFVVGTLWSISDLFLLMRRVSIEVGQKAESPPPSLSPDVQKRTRAGAGFYFVAPEVDEKVREP